ncbi:MAG: hypothetical protein KKA67_14380 [Spirochaetes bacterium]|nr:hypothetical protein [Spirochaetota bacterium]MBU1081531.1 hypothetical protein [Spirochaetota bacterium]
MEGNDLDELVGRKKRGEKGLEGKILERIAADVYRRPRLYGFDSEDDVGEVFERYWTRIGGLADRYEDIGYSFHAFLVSSLRYMAMSIRRTKAWNLDRENALQDEIKAETRAALASYPFGRSGTRPTGTLKGFPRPDDTSLTAVAFRRRIFYLCVKCANIIGDDEAIAVADIVGINVAELLHVLTLARSRGLGLRSRTVSRRRGRDAAWLRMRSCGRRLAREPDQDRRRYLADRIEKDRGLYSRATRLISRSCPILSNKTVAELLGIPKGTVDCGVGRVMKLCSTLTTDGADR